MSDRKLNLVVVNAQVVVTLPDGCQWSVSDPDDGYTNVTDYIGGPDGITFFNGTGFMGLSSTRTMIRDSAIMA